MRDFIRDKKKKKRENFPKRFGFTEIIIKFHPSVKRRSIVLLRYYAFESICVTVKSNIPSLEFLLKKSIKKKKHISRLLNII